MLDVKAICKTKRIVRCKKRYDRRAESSRRECNRTQERANLYEREQQQIHRHLLNESEDCDIYKDSREIMQNHLQSCPGGIRSLLKTTVGNRLIWAYSCCTVHSGRKRLISPVKPGGKVLLAEQSSGVLVYSGNFRGPAVSSLPT